MVLTKLGKMIILQNFPRNVHNAIGQNQNCPKLSSNCVNTMLYDVWKIYTLDVYFWTKKTK